MILRILAAVLRVLQILLFGGILLFWFPMDENSRIVKVVRACTEPLLIPVRALLSKIRFLQKIPFDFSYIVVFLFVELIIQLII